MSENALRPYWNKYIRFDWRFGLFLIALVCIPRFLLVLHANQTGNYGPIGAIMLVSALLPFVFLSKTGRRQIGIRGTEKIGVLALAFALGIGFSLVLYFLGEGLYGASFQNWYAYIGKSYNIPEGISHDDKLPLFAIMAATGMVFSPVGEELFFRGIVHGSFAKSMGEKKASLIDALAFALTHIAHFGLVYVNGRWNFYPVPTVLWVSAMFGVSLAFIAMKNTSGSLLGAIFCHAGFNLGMIYCIFYGL